MKYKLPAAITLTGWILLFSFFLFRPEGHFHPAFYALFFLSPVASTAMGYLVYERYRDGEIKKGYEEILKRASDEWRATFDSMPIGVLLLDAHYNIVKANGFMAEIARMPVADLAGRKCHEVMHGSGTPVGGCPLKVSVKTGKACSSEYLDDKTGRHFSTISTPIMEDGVPMAYVHTYVDLTSVKDKEKKLEQGKAAFFNMLKDASLSYVELKGLHQGLILTFAKAIDAKSAWTNGHSERVTHYAVAIASEMGLKDKDVETLRTAALLHDIGKIGVYDSVLDKPAKLTDEEFAMIKTHPAKGVEILGPIKELGHILPIIRAHHERVDGRGYPDNLRGEDIPLLARILCVADSFDSMMADRPYRPSPGMEYAVSELKRCAGSQFDPVVVDAILRVLDRESGRAEAPATAGDAVRTAIATGGD